jgi:hypothetical protein
MLAHVPKANPSRIKAPVASCNSRYGLIAKALQIQRIKLRAIFMVTSYFHTKSLYHGLAKLTMVVITIAVAIRIIIVVCIGLNKKINQISF